MTEALIRDGLLLWATIDPIGTLAIFAAVAAHMNPAMRRKTALKATIYSAIILVGSILLGQLLLKWMGIELVALQLAGGFILFLFGLKMVFGTIVDTDGPQPEKGHDVAVFPLAVPSIASPGAIMAVILLTDNDTHTVAQQLSTTGVLLFILLATYVIMLAANPILRVIGQNGAAILIRVMGLILAALSVQFVMDAIARIVI